MRVQQLLTFRRCFLSLLFLLPWALCLQKAINMWRWQEMSVGFECWRVVVNIPDEGGWNERSAGALWRPATAFDLLFKSRAQEQFRSAEFCFKQWGSLQLKSSAYVGHGDCDARENTFLKEITEVGYANETEAERRRVAGSVKAARRKQRLDTVQLLLLINTFRSSCCSDIFTAGFTHTTVAFRH